MHRPSAVLLARAVVVALIALASPLRAQERADSVHGAGPPCSLLAVDGRSCALHDVSMVQLLANPERYDGLRVRVIGFVHLEFEGQAVYLHREDFDEALLGNALWVDFRPGTLSASRPIGDRYVLLEGTFDAHHRGHMGLFGGTIGDITRAGPWPSRAEIERRLDAGFQSLKRVP